MVPRVDLVLEYKGGGFFVEKFNYALQEQQGNKESEEFITRRIVIKIGSSTITDGTEDLDIAFIENISQQVGLLFRKGVEILIVTSGAVASGKKGLKSVDTILDKQVAALYGQPELISEWRRALNNNGVKKVGQLLVTDNDLGDIKDVTIKALSYGVVVANANDPVSNYEMKKYLISQDNDRLAGHIAKTIDADTLLLLTDVEGVLDKDGKTIKTFNSNEEVVIFSSSTGLGTGGISSKIEVAQKFSGRAIIVNGRTKDVLLKVSRGEKIGTQFH